MQHLKMLDLFCGAGGSAMGYHRAGFEVWGIDIAPQPNYPCAPFCEMDALALDVDFIRDTFDAVHASPPCQRFTAYRRRGSGVGESHQDLVEQTREILKATGLPYIIENVKGAPLNDPFQLCGSMFGLDVQRHRLFESNVYDAGLTEHPPCDHSVWTPRFPPATNRKNLRKTVEVGVWRIPLDVQMRAMGVDWKVTRHELSQMVPPAYTEWIGKKLIGALCPT